MNRPSPLETALLSAGFFFLIGLCFVLVEAGLWVCVEVAALLAAGVHFGAGASLLSASAPGERTRRRGMLMLAVGAALAGASALLFCL